MPPANFGSPHSHSSGGRQRSLIRVIQGQQLSSREGETPIVYAGLLSSAMSHQCGSGAYVRNVLPFPVLSAFSHHMNTEHLSGDRQQPARRRGIWLLPSSHTLIACTYISLQWLWECRWANSGVKPSCCMICSSILRQESQVLSAHSIPAQRPPPPPPPPPPPYMPGCEPL